MANNSNTPTLKQKLFAQEYVKNKGNGVQAALKVYDADYKSAKGIAVENLQKPVVQREITMILNKAGLSIEHVADYLRDAMKAGLTVKATNGDAIRAIDMMLKLYNAYPAKQSVQFSYSKKEIAVNKNPSENAKDLEAQIARSNKLLEDLK